METSRSAADRLKALPEGSFVRAGDLPCTSAAARNALSRAARSGELICVHRGLYFKGPKTRYGIASPSVKDIALAVLPSDGVGPAMYSAARAFGFTTQVPAALELAVAGPLVQGLRGVRLHKRNNVRRAKLSFLEIGLLEVLRKPDTVDGGWPALVRGIRKAVERNDIRLDAVAGAVPAEHSPALRERFDKLSVALAA